MTLQQPYLYPKPQTEMTITTSEYRLLQQLYRRIIQERLAAQTRDSDEALNAAHRTDATLSQLTAIYHS